jgi:hypothetical protein
MIMNSTKMIRSKQLIGEGIHKTNSHADSLLRHLPTKIIMQNKQCAAIYFEIH